MSPEATDVFITRYIKPGLGAMPDVMETLLNGITPFELDFRPAPERFTLREAVAHLADWEPIWQERMRKVQAEANPVLVSYDESQWAIDHDYAHSDFTFQLEKFRTGRAEVMVLLNTMPASAWSRPAQHFLLGNITLGDLAIFILGHDSYHLRQIVEFRKLSQEHSRP